MTQQVTKPPAKDEGQPQSIQASAGRPRRYSLVSVTLFLVLLACIILASTGLLFYSLAEEPASSVTQSGTSTPASTGATTLPGTATPTVDANATPTVTPPIAIPGKATSTPLQLPNGHFVIYEQQNFIYYVSTTDDEPQLITTPGYIYSEAVRPILTPAGQLLYSGDGIWLADIFGGTQTQLAPLAANQVITSMALSSDGTTVAWSTEPVSGDGLIDIYAGPLSAPIKVYEQATTNCPCFRVFGFMNGVGKAGNTTLLLADGQQSHEAVQFGLWALDLSQPTAATPQELMSSSNPQGPLALMPYGNVLLYSTYEGNVPMPTDESVPDDLATLNYANSLSVATIGSQPLGLDTAQVVLPEQRQLNNHVAAYHWVTTPVFTVDGHTLIYVEFSTQAQAPYDRTSAIFEAQISGTGKHLRVGSPQLLATSTAALLELGAWFNNRILTFYADNSLYALDVQSGAVTPIVQTGAYARIVAVIGLGGV